MDGMGEVVEGKGLRSSELEPKRTEAGVGAEEEEGGGMRIT